MCLPDAPLPQVSTAAGSVKLQQSGWIQARHGKTDWTDQGLHLDIHYVCRLYAQENCLLASVLLVVLSTCELFKVTKGGQIQSSHRQRVRHCLFSFSVVECKSHYIPLPSKWLFFNVRATILTRM